MLNPTMLSCGATVLKIAASCGSADFRTLIPPGAATGLLSAVAALLQALVAVVAALREK